MCVDEALIFASYMSSLWSLELRPSKLGFRLILIWLDKVPYFDWSYLCWFHVLGPAGPPGERGAPGKGDKGDKGRMHFIKFSISFWWCLDKTIF